jgi:hypothetical protein
MVRMTTDQRRTAEISAVERELRCPPMKSSPHPVAAPLSMSAPGPACCAC